MASSRSIPELLSAWRSLPGSDRLFLGHAWWTLTRVSVDLRLRSLRAIWAACRRRAERGPGPAARWVPTDPYRANWLVEVADRFHPLRGTCLTRSLALGRLLAGVGVVTELQIGVERFPSGLAAHAWLALDGEPITEVPAEDRYTALGPLPG